MGIKYSATVPLVYLLVSATTLGIYIWNLNFEFFRFAQTSLYLFVPFIMQWSIGSYVTSSGVMLWALLAPIGVMIFQGPKESVPWFFVLITLSLALVTMELLREFRSTGMTEKLDVRLLFTLKLMPYGIAHQQILVAVFWQLRIGLAKRVFR
jgi:hypothetical protein